MELSSSEMKTIQHQYDALAKKVLKGEARSYYRELSKRAALNVDHQLLRSAETGYYIEKPKTQSGIRQIPMSEKVYEALGRVLENRKGAKQITIDGYSNFLFLNRDGCPKTNVNYATMFRGLAKKYNKCHEEALPKVMTPHTLRHTFCTNLANAGMNPKALQYIMGHSNITMTLNYYAHATFASARAEMERLIAA